ncbi:response regulator [Oleidesulfovibrio sp.]|uniref:response regulator n=1 Tax=Oleidesulfovibrio sp. TaxID=2909707 RepID=UPI003A8A36DC
MTRPSRVLIVDDNHVNILILKQILEEEHQVFAAVSGPEALELASGRPQPDIILLDVLMPEMDGYEVCRRLKENIQTKDIPVLFVTTQGEEEDEAAGLAMGAVDYIVKPVRPSIVLARVRNHLQLKMHQDRLEELVRDRTVELQLTQDVTIFSLACLAEMRDNELGGHFKRTQNYVRLFATVAKDRGAYLDYWSETPISMLYKSAPLHDVGKVGVPDNILLKPGKLTDEEFAVMKLHTVYGRDSLERAESLLQYKSFLSVAKEIAYSHHERWDGRGYPEGLAGDKIPVSGRIMAIADVYDALISKRVYKDPFPHSKAVQIVLEGCGTHFDPLLCEIFEEHQNDIRTIALADADLEEERLALSM